MGVLIYIHTGKISASSSVSGGWILNAFSLHPTGWLPGVPDKPATSKSPFWPGPSHQRSRAWDTNDRNGQTKFQFPSKTTDFTSWWLNQPSWTICSSKLDHFPQFSRWTWKICELPPPSFLSSHEIMLLEHLLRWRFSLQNMCANNFLTDDFWSFEKKPNHETFRGLIFEPRDE